MTPELFLQVADLFSEPFLLVSGEGHIVAANRAAGKRWQHGRQELVGKCLVEIVTDDPSIVTGYLSACSRSREPLPGALVMRCGATETLPCRCEGAVAVPRSADAPALIQLRFFPKAEAPSRFVFLNERLDALTRELAARKRMEEALLKRQAEIEVLNMRLQQAMTETHHRVKNNLQLMSALIDMLRSSGRETVPMSELARLSANVRALGVIHDILTQEAKEGSDQETLSAKTILEKLTQMLAQTTGSRPLVSTFEEMRLLGKQATALALVTNELVSNALKHGRGQTEISCRAENDTAVLEVCDDGPGFPAGFDASRAAHTGLELVENVVKWDLRGNVFYESGPEGGGRVIVSFPILTHKDAAPPAT